MKGDLPKMMNPQMMAALNAHLQQRAAQNPGQTPGIPAIPAIPHNTGAIPAAPGIHPVDHALMLEVEKQKVKDHLKKIRHHELKKEVDEVVKSRHKDIQDEQDKLFSSK